MMKKELEDNSENYIMWSFLGDSFLVAGKLEEAEEAYLQVVEHRCIAMEIDRRNLTFFYLLKTKVARIWMVKKRFWMFIK